jgi:aminoglycoside phosphotransferase (APT) family kinase protein
VTVNGLDVEVVRCLLREQFPQWADRPVTAVEPGGWDNRTFRIGAELSARLRSVADSSVSTSWDRSRWADT